ncbi:unnamed protein product [Oikopleura dioica]|uniref:OTU domain-containing protein n=1 Tax=Oikopleura dioica TaxID=34765 RepID=E4Y8L8_OIKDI|nr:unnamed protein product [Oikopleura dioica]
MRATKRTHSQATDTQHVSNQDSLKEAQCIVSRRTRADGGTQYLVKLGEDYNSSWVDEEKCKEYLSDMINDFNSKYSKTSLKRSKKLTQSATKELKSQGVNFSIGPGGDKSMHHQFVENIRKHGLKVWKDAHADGNCFFHSVVFILEQIGKNKRKFTYKTLREMSCKTLKKNLSEYKEFLDEDPQEYLKYMMQDGEWADHVIIQVCAEVLRRPILIVNSDPWNELVFVKPRTTDKVHGRAIILGHLNNEHYVSLTIKIPEI